MFRLSVTGTSMAKAPISLNDLPDPADNAAVEALARRYRPALIRYFERKGVSPMDAEDAVQEVFSRLVRRGGVAGIERLDRYLFEAAGNVAVDYHRRAGARGGGRHVVYQEARHAPAETSAEAAYGDRQDLERVLTVLREMPERTRTIFILVRLEEVKQVDVARRLGLSISAVEKHMRNAVARLHDRLGRPL